MRDGILEFSFNNTKPYLPFEQLLSVLPCSSAPLLPLSYQSILLNPPSCLVPFYVKSFTLDLEYSGFYKFFYFLYFFLFFFKQKYKKEFVWEAITDIPFIDLDLLTEEMKKLKVNLSEEEKNRNSEKKNEIFLHKNYSLCQFIDLKSNSLSFSQLNTRLVGEVENLFPTKNCPNILRGKSNFKKKLLKSKKNFTN